MFKGRNGIDMHHRLLTLTTAVLGLLSHAIPASTPLRNCGAGIIKHLFSRTNLSITVVRESSEAQEDD